MRITSGLARGIQLTAPRGQSVRPTEDKVKEAMFAAIGDYIRHAIVLDLFAGTGALGLESLSRGADEVYAFEKQAEHLPFIRKNYEAVLKSMHGQAGKYQILHADARNAVKMLQPGIRNINLILADPPYETAEGAYGAENLILDRELSGKCAPECLLVLEHATGKHLPWKQNPDWKLIKEKKYGIRTVAFAIKNTEEITAG